MSNSGNKKPDKAPAKSWCVYLLECRDGSFYTGITNQLAKRYAAHESGKAARYTRSHPPVRLIGSLPCIDRSQASIKEYQIKQLSRTRKLAMFMKEKV
ncbi:MAG TPA: GIY-YIG nuclease family protein [Arenimonas sp.]|nr:GIY-YIG nuclease family protein [Arenimonas sp.]HOZ04506.1 GIY-YIG nuclease family protein [Arenimonas sp.]HPW32170.1 GIY-YIG nuclease family protein [Arenimonas sp.]